MLLARSSHAQWLMPLLTCLRYEGLPPKTTPSSPLGTSCGGLFFVKRLALRLAGVRDPTLRPLSTDALTACCDRTHEQIPGDRCDADRVCDPGAG